MADTLFRIEGMTCPHCVMRVSRAILDVSGVTDVDVNPKKSEAVVSHDGVLDEAAVKKAVEGAGYLAMKA